MQTVIPIQALRALAALAVAACHYDQVRLMLSSRGAEVGPLFSLSAGVDVFFVISGFIMVFSSERLFAARGGSVEFLTRRLARIVPLYWVTTGLAVWLMNRPIDWHSGLGSLLFIPHRDVSGAIVPLHGVGWTLNFEMFFYSLFAVAVVWRRTIAVPGLCVALAAIVVAGSWLQPGFVPFSYWSDPIILEFAAGMLIALAYRNNARLPTVLRAVLIPAALFAMWSTPEHMPPSGYRFLVWGVPAAILVAAAALGSRETPARWIAAPVKLLGDASYALYLIHPLMGAVVLLGWPHGLNRYPIMAIVLTTAVITQIIAIGVHVWLERPCTRALVDFARRRPARSAIEPAT